MNREATTTIVLQYSSNIRGIIVCGSCGDRTTATESKLSVRTVNIGASAFKKDPAIPNCMYVYMYSTTLHAFPLLTV